jgi:hypothetical protein
MPGRIQDNKERGHWILGKVNEAFSAQSIDCLGGRRVGEQIADLLWPDSMAMQP